MISSEVPYIASLLLTALLSALVGGLFWSRKTARGAWACLALMVGAFMWALAETILQTAISKQGLWLGLWVRQFAAIIVPVAWYAFARQYGGYRFRMADLGLVLLWPLFSLGVVIVQGNDTLFWYLSVGYYTGQPLRELVTYGTFFWGHWFFMLTLILAGAWSILVVLLRASAHYRAQSIMVLIAMLLPVAAFGLHLAHVGFFALLDFTPLLFNVTGVFFYWQLTRSSFLNVVPMARDNIIENLQDGVLIFNPSGHLADFNPAAQRILGPDADLNVGQAATYVFRDHMALMELLAGRDDVAYELEADGVMYDAQVTQLLDAYGQRQGQILVLRDISERKQVEAQLRMASELLEQRVKERTVALTEANEALQHAVAEHKQAESALLQERDRATEMSRVKSVFLANMSHEIRTPLTGILGFTQILAMEVPERLQEFVSAIDNSGRRLLDTLTAVLELSRLEAGQVDLNPTTFEIAEEMSLILDLFERRATKKDLQLEWSGPSSPTLIYADRGALNCILQNLLGNAIKFTDEGGVYVTVEAQGRDIQLRVADTGIGISEEFLPHLFDQFRREDEGINAAYEGSGLGLTLVKRFVDLLNGSIEVSSKQPGGTTFSIHLPGLIVEEAETDEVASEFELMMPHRYQKRLLVVEDNETTAAFMQRMLEPHFHLNIARTPEEARGHWQDYVFDVVLMDINLGIAQEDGRSLMRNFRADAERGGTPIVAVTAYALPGDKEDFLAEGFDAYVSKPFEQSKLFAVINRLLHQQDRQPIAPERNRTASAFPSPEQD